MRFTTTVALVTLLAFTGCVAHRSPASFRTVVNPECLTAPIVMKGCDVSGEPVHSRSVVLRDRAGCETIDAQQSKK